ncbi:MAG TPA: metallophosphoesterase [Bacillota bacterium]|nr:serine/threonine protein phosphatase [Fastidiosipila sp.]HPX93112.1 metallophosphoesterase [Bacillota bacterium]HQB81355.1 metallophosphoesterase [Bacillota bacterium]
MKLFALADLHLAGSVDKPMDIFGPRWESHTERIVENWLDLVDPDDTVLVGGDISWAKSLEEALPDLALIHRLPGKKILLRGNHDYWWTTLRKLEAFCEREGLTSLHFLRNKACRAAGFHICGTRGWLLPFDEEFSNADEKIYKREIARLELSIQALKRLQEEEGREPGRVALMHYPPISEQGTGSAFSDLLKEAGIHVCLFGHIHHDVPFYDSQPQIEGVRYIMVASDQIGFRPLLVGEDGRFATAVERQG